MDEVRTGVDELMALLADGSRISIHEAAKRLKESDSTVQNWADFLVEEKLIGIEYKFTTPYIYRNAPIQRAVQKAVPETIDSIRAQFVAHAREKGIPQEKIAELWENHLLSAIEQKQGFFKDECSRRNLFNVEELMERYTERIISEYGLRHMA